MAVVNVDIAHSSGEATGTGAVEVIEEVVASRSILTRCRLTLVYLNATVLTSVACHTYAGVVVAMVILKERQ